MISKEDIENLATLARLKLSAEEAEALQKDITNILGYVSQIEGFSADAHASEMPLQRNVLREDAVRTEGDTMAEHEEAIAAQFPRREGSHNVVRKIIQKDE